jgi:hypothetical protein
MRTTCATCGPGGSCNGGCGNQSCAVAFTATRR